MVGPLLLSTLNPFNLISQDLDVRDVSVLRYVSWPPQHTSIGGQAGGAPVPEQRDDRFAVVTELVRGVPMQMYKNRHHSLRALFDASVTRYADRDHVVFGEQRTTFAQLEGRVAALAGGLARRGIGHGDRVAILAANHPAWVETLWATTRLGAILVGLNGWWAADELDYALRDSSPRVLIVDTKRLERIADVLGPDSPVEHVVVVDGDGTEAGATETYEQLFNGEPDAGVHPVDEDDVAVILYTSGTTGRSKGAMWTHRSMLSALQSNAHLLARSRAEMPPSTEAPTKGSRSGIAILVSVPLFHTSGLQASVVAAMASGAKAVILEGRFRPEEVLRLVDEEKISAWGAVPTMVLQVLDHPDVEKYDLSSLRSISYGGSPSSTDLQARARETLGVAARVGNAYGLTETTAAVITINGDEFYERPDSVGRPHPLVEVRIADDDGNALPSGQLGEIQIKAPMVMAGYWQNEDATAAALTEGWLRTGDIGEVDADGYVYVRDRKKDMIIRGGENVYCAEIEDRIEQHPAVVESAVVGVPHPVLGEEVKAIVRLRDGDDLDAKELQAWVGETLAHFKVPSSVEFVKEELPRNATGKILKNLLREQPAS
jgi:long-chain acyl-CoA synthetase